MNCKTLEGSEEEEVVLQGTTHGLNPRALFHPKQVFYQMSALKQHHLSSDCECEHKFSTSNELSKFTILSIPLGPRLVLMASATAVKRVTKVTH